MDNLDELGRQRATNTERQRRRREQGSQEEGDIVNESRRLNHQQSDSERETHTERSRLSQERIKEEMSNMYSDNNNKIIFKYFIAPCVSTDNGTGAVPLVLLNWKVKNFQNGFINAREEGPCKLLWNKKKVIRTGRIYRFVLKQFYLLVALQLFKIKP
jgi:Tfp pilus tip-associated adhesin PilY1